jgi:hypothetical protein
MPSPYTFCTKNSAPNKKGEELLTLPYAMAFLRFVQGTRINRTSRIGFIVNHEIKRASCWLAGAPMTGVVARVTS